MCIRDSLLQLALFFFAARLAGILQVVQKRLLLAKTLEQAGVFLRKRRNPLLRRAQLSRQMIVLPAKLFLLTPGLLRLAPEPVERRRASFRSGTAQRSQKPVSYTHLDVYKRQACEGLVYFCAVVCKK